jgi:hypothetical protein
MTRTRQERHRRTAIAAAASDLYMSDACHIGTHHTCRDGRSRSPEPEAGVSYQMCGCACHREHQ